MAEIDGALSVMKQVTQAEFKSSRLRALRYERELSADRLAELTGLTTQHIYRLERGERPNVWGVTLAKLAIALDTTTDYLLNLTVDPRPPTTVHVHPATPTMML
jgi:transcriptional regulator with XRE-family HTH domain